jgi:hypothetical protein
MATSAPRDAWRTALESTQTIHDKRLFLLFITIYPEG